jgi:hypothetical protein
MEILPKGTRVAGHLESPRADRAALVLALDSFERGGRWFTLSTNVVSRTGNPDRGHLELHSGINKGAADRETAPVSVPADSIIGFTLKSTLTA